MIGGRVPELTEGRGHPRDNSFPEAVRHAIAQLAWANFYFFMSLLIAAVVVNGFSFTAVKRLFHTNTIIYRLPYWITVTHIILR